MENNHLDVNNDPVRTGFYQGKQVDRILFFVDVERDLYEVINPLSSSVVRRGRISERARNYFDKARPVSAQAYIDYHQQHVDFFRARLEIAKR